MFFNCNFNFFWNFKNKAVFNKRINLGADYFYYYPAEVVYDAWGSDKYYVGQIDENGSEAVVGDGGNAKRYVRITSGIGIPFWYFNRGSTDFNINNIMYFGATTNNTFDINFTYNFGLGQIITGYETSTKLSADFANFYLINDELEKIADNENYIQFPNFYIALRLGVSLPYGEGTLFDQSKKRSHVFKESESISFQFSL